MLQHRPAHPRRASKSVAALKYWKIGLSPTLKDRRIMEHAENWPARAQSRFASPHPNPHSRSQQRGSSTFSLDANRNISRPKNLFPGSASAIQLAGEKCKTKNPNYFARIQER
jgi:hypothetical protein